MEQELTFNLSRKPIITMGINTKDKYTQLLWCKNAKSLALLLPLQYRTYLRLTQFFNYMSGTTHDLEEYLQAIKTNQFFWARQANLSFTLIETPG